jgi:acyl-CoA thioester hydrolase
MAVETLKAVAHPWLCDAMGHMNVRYYTAFFDDASCQLVGMLGHGMEQSSSSGLGWADVRHVVEFQDEVKSGALLAIRSHVVKVGRTSLTFRHVMTGLSGTVHATMDVVSVMFDLNVRRASPLPDSVRLAAEKFLIQEDASATH